MTTSTRRERRLGRPRKFDEDATLEAALRVFWEKGYEGATAAELTAAMGINRSSLYATWGDKQSVFRHTVERYRRRQLTFMEQALARPALRDVVAGLIHGTADFLSLPGNPRGCLLLQGALASGTHAEPVKQSLIASRKSAEAAIRRRLQRGMAQGELRPGIKPADFARYLAAVIAGLGIQAANGATPAELHRVAALALRCLQPCLQPPPRSPLPH